MPERPQARIYFPPKNIHYSVTVVPEGFPGPPEYTIKSFVKFLQGISRVLFPPPKRDWAIVMSATASPGLNACWPGSASALTSLSGQCVKKPIQDLKKIVCAGNL